MTAPTLSVVVVVLSGRDCLARCLSALGPQVEETGAELLVPCDDALGDVEELRARFPAARFIEASGTRSYAELRALAFREARGEVVALTEDHCTPDPDWCANVLQAHAAPHAAMRRRPSDWRVFEASNQPSSAPKPLPAMKPATAIPKPVSQIGFASSQLRGFRIPSMTP